MDIEKGKLPKGLSYPLKSSALSNALEAADISVSIHLIYEANQLFFEAFYWLPNDNVEYDRFYIRTGAVKSEHAKLARTEMGNHVIPEFIKWAKEILSLPQNSPKLQEKLHFAKSF